MIDFSDNAGKHVRRLRPYRPVPSSRGTQIATFFTWLVGAAAWLGIMGGFAPREINAQDPAAAPSTGTEVTAESLESLRKQAAESPDLDVETKQKIEATITQSLEALTRITETVARSKDYKRDTDDVQKRVAELRQRLIKLQSVDPTLPTEMTLAELEQEVSQQVVKLEELKAEQTKSEAMPSSRAIRRREIRELLLTSNQRIAEIQEQLALDPPADELNLMTRARRAALQVRLMLIEAEQPALQNELAKYDAEDALDFVRILRDVQTQEVTNASYRLEQLQKVLARRRSADSAAAVQRATETLASVPLQLKDQAEENLSLANSALELSDPIEESRRKLESTKARLEEVQKQFILTQRRVDEIGLTGSIGSLLRRQQVKLPDLKRRKDNIQQRRDLIESTQYKLFEFNDLRSESVERSLERLLTNLKAQDQVEQQRLINNAQLLVEQRRELLNGVIRNYNTYLDTLFELDASEQLLIRVTQRYESYIDERVLWIRSNKVLFSSWKVDESDRWMFEPSKWIEVGKFISFDIRTHPIPYGAVVLAFVLLLWQKPRFRRELEATSQVAARGSCSQFSPTLRAAFLTFMLSIALPGIIIFLGWRLSVSSNGSKFVAAVSQALYSVCWVFFPLEILRRVCRRRGLADSHLDWPSSTIRVLRVNLRWATVVGPIIVFVSSILYASGPEHEIDSLERVFFVIGMIILTVFLRRVLHPDTGIFREHLATYPGGWFDRLQIVWYWICMLVPMAAAGMAIFGYYYTAQQLTWRFYETFVFLLLVQLIQAFLNRLLLVHRRSISIQQAREKRASELAMREQAEGAPAPPLAAAQIVTQDALQSDVAVNTQKSRRLIRTGMIAASLVGLWLIWVDVLPALRILDQWAVWQTTQSVALAETDSPPTRVLGGLQTGSESDTTTSSVLQPIETIYTVTVADIGLAIMIGIVTVIAARNIPGLMEISILQKLPLDNSIRYAITSVSSYAIVLLGTILAFNAISIGWSQVQWVATALTFGLAFGLQEIFANFVAGLILLFERPIRVGDVVTVDDVSGYVSRIRIRATTITNWERKEYVIPNKEFITGRMLNWTLSDNILRIVINVGVAYGSDVDLAKRLLRQACAEHPKVLEDPPPLISFEEFGDSSLNLVVRAFLPDVESRLIVVDDLHGEINRSFRQAGIEIAFPQRDLHLRSIDADVKQSLGQPTENKAT
jgi:potassium efflux system protein